MLTDELECCDFFIRLSFWRHPFTAEHPLTLILTAPIHCRASIDSHSDGTHSLQSIHWLSFWRHPFTAEHPLLKHISTNLMKKQAHLHLGRPEAEHMFMFGWVIIAFRLMWAASPVAGLAPETPPAGHWPQARWSGGARWTWSQRLPLGSAWRLGHTKSPSFTNASPIFNTVLERFEH